MFKLLLEGLPETDVNFNKLERKICEIIGAKSWKYRLTKCNSYVPLVLMFLCECETL